jgi:hypothetical protein
MYGQYDEASFSIALDSPVINNGVSADFFYVDTGNRVPGIGTWEPVRPSDVQPIPPASALRYDTGKVDPSMIPVDFIVALSAVYTDGAVKYERDNWWKGMKWTRVIGPTFRHLLKFLCGERFDPETGHHHLIHVAWNVCTLFIYDTHGIGEDDRKKTLPIDDQMRIVYK